jgi:hypothetical protein
VSSGYLDRKAFELSNHGAGVAIVRKLSFHRGKRKASNVLGIVKLDKLTEDGLVGQGFSKSAAAALLAELETQLDEIQVTATYEDILGNVIVKDAELP